MKKFYFIFILLFPFAVFSQNWNLITLNSNYHYATSPNGQYDITIKVDSFDVAGSDTTFYLNRITKPIHSDSVLLINLPAFLQREVIKHDSVYTFNDTLNFNILALSDTGTSYIFDTINNVSATIIQKNLTNTLGVSDSVKIIVLSTNDTLIISKNFGIIQFQYDTLQYYLIGKETGTQFWGFKNPKFHDFYDIGNIGDVFQYHSYEWSEGGGEAEIADTKKTIIGKSDYTDSIKYIFDVKVLSHDTFWTQVNYLQYTDTITYVDSINDLSNTYNRNKIKYHDDNFYPVNDFYCPVYVLTDDSNRIIKRTCLGEPSQFWGTNFYLTDSSNSGQLIYYELYQNYIKQIKYGLGYTYEGFNQFVGTGYIKLTGYIKNGDTTGTVYSDGYLTGIHNTNKTSQKIFVYPNPAQNQLTVIARSGATASSELVSEKQSQISIYNLQGQEVKSIKLKSKKVVVNIADLSAGLYFVKVQTNKGSVIKKFVKQ